MMTAIEKTLSTAQAALSADIQDVRRRHHAALAAQLVGQTHPFTVVQYHGEDSDWITVNGTVTAIKYGYDGELVILFKYTDPHTGETLVGDYG